MDDAKRELLGMWIDRAESDLGSAKKLLSGSEIFPDNALFHCQQAAEKSLKGYLLLHDVEFEKTHDLVLLIGMCASIDEGFLNLRDAAKALTPYAVLFRYPIENDEKGAGPSKFQAEDGLAMATEFVSFVTSRLPSNFS